MPQSLANIAIHVVFSTKNRKPWLQNEPLRSELHGQLAATSGRMGCAALAVGGVEDHVHLLGRLVRTASVADWIKELKRTSSLWIKRRDRRLAQFQWQAGYGAFSVSQSNVRAVVRYIENQVAHHRTCGFQDEYRMLLTRHQINFDERYVWD